MTIQDKALAAIKKLAKNFGLEFVEQRQWANTGSVMLMDDLDNVLHFGYQFHRDYAVLQFYPGDKPIVNTCGFTHQACIQDAYIPYHELYKLHKTLAWLANELSKIRQTSQIGVTA